MDERGFFVILSVLLTALAAQAQEYIFGRADFAVGNFPISVATGDFNGDGLPDLVVTNSGDNTVSVLLGRPNATFAPQVTYATGPEPIAVVVGDFNGDGILDLAVTNGNCTEVGSADELCPPSTVSILLGNGDGTFQSHVDYSVGSFPSSLVAADFNGDGNLDLAIVNGSTVSVLLGNGDGTFQPQVTYAIKPSSGIVVGDFNNDGKLDLAVSGGSVLLGNGNGTFQPHIDSSFAGVSLAAADFNGDGNLDLAVATSSSLEVFMGQGNGTFILQGEYAGGSTVVAADLNGNGIVDLVSAGANDNSDNSSLVATLLGNGDGTFQAPVYYGTSYLSFGLVVTDLNGDGKLDLAAVNSGCAFGSLCGEPQIPPGTISVLLGFGDGTFVGQTYYSVVSQGAQFFSYLVAVDLTGDGNLDLVTTNGDLDSISVLLGNANGTFQPAVQYSVSYPPEQLATGDFRNNGDVDLVVVNNTCSSSPCTTAGSVSVLLGNGNGTFQPAVSYGVGFQPQDVAVGSFRGNGILDLAVVNYISNSVSILLGNGNGTFQPQVQYLTVITNPLQVAIGDFNGDGKLDLVVLGATGFSILLGNGDGTFQTARTNSTGGLSMATADFNGDGKLDLAILDNYQISILLGNGDGTFQAPLVDSLDAQGYALEVADFNQDGEVDLAAISASDVLIQLGNGNGTFQQPVPYALASGAITLADGDFNNDGAPDLAATSPGNGSNGISVLLSAAFKALAPGSLNFGSQGVGTTSAPLAITVSNPSNVNIQIASIIASGSFAETNTCGTSLGLLASCQISVTFSPTATGSQSGAITITDSTRISPLAIPLSGSGVNGAFLSISPPRQDFSPKVVGSSSTAAAIMLANTGNAALTISGIAITGDDKADFSQTNNCRASLSAGGNCTVNAIFAPTAAGPRIASLTVTDSAAGSPQMITLFGFATDFTIGAASGSPTSQTMNAGQTASFTLALGATGSFTGTINLSCAITPVVTPAPTCNLSSSSVQISGSGTQSVTVKVGTTAPVTTSAVPHIGFPAGTLITCTLMLWGSVWLWMGSDRRRRVLAAPVMVLTLSLLVSCGSGGNSSSTTSGGTSGGTPAGTYAATVTGTSGSLSHNVALQVVVQ